MTDYLFTAAGVTDVGGNPKKENQDTFLMDATRGLLGVFDGHGQHGLKAAQIARDTTSAGGSFADAEAAFKAYLLGHRDARAQEDGNVVLWGEPMTGWSRPMRGGTTASVVRVAGRKVTVDHVGDSEVMVVDCATGEFKILCNDHSSTSVAEYERALKEATVTPNVFFDTQNGMSARPVFTPAAGGGWELNPTSGYYVSNVRRDWAAYVSRGETQLNMFRAIGDFGLKAAGVTCEPDRLEHTLAAEGRSVVLVASDGLFDPLQYEAIRDCIQAKKSGTAAEIAAAVLSLGLSEGKRLFGNGHDNTTVCVGVVDPRIENARENLHSSAVEDAPAHAKELCLGEPIGY